MVEQERGISIKDILLFPYRFFVATWMIFSAITYSSLVIVLMPISKKASKQAGRLWMKHLLFFSRVSVRTFGSEKLAKDKHYIFIANHQSYYDIPVLFAGLPFFLGFIAKKQLFQIPIFGWAMAAVGHIWIDRDNARKARQSISRAVAKLNKENISLVLFPEGTRSSGEGLGAFKRGSFTLAIEAGVAVVPVSIVGAETILAKRSLRLMAGKVHIIIGDPIPHSVIEGLDKNQISALVREKMVDGISMGKNEVLKNA